MYTLAVQRDFIASHYLIGGDWGPENQLHSHHYRVEVILEAPELDRHGYIVDIVDLETNIEELVDYFRDQTLNELAEFKGLNPSIEHFCRIFLTAISAKIQAENLSAITVKIWENEIAWTSYREKFQATRLVKSAHP
jgi:6-pyruvoyltetrahydropterin/6-carboxytetrahydropterin synthase